MWEFWLIGTGFGLLVGTTIAVIAYHVGYDRGYIRGVKAGRNDHTPIW